MGLDQGTGGRRGAGGRAVAAEDAGRDPGAVHHQQELGGERLGRLELRLARQRGEALADRSLVGEGDLASRVLGLRELGGGGLETAAEALRARRAPGERAKGGEQTCLVLSEVDGPVFKVVKALNTTNASVMVDPGAVAGADHTLLLCGNDAQAKAQVVEPLRSLGWKDVLDVGDISAARGTETLLPLWLRLSGSLQTPLFNSEVVR